ncbi:guanylate kinase [bacterium]|nr:guanylate kinase [bacterium]
MDKKHKKNDDIFKGIIFIISAPSGGGKTTLCKRVLKVVPNLTFSISMTTRPARKGEKNGRDYFFLPENDFIKKIKQKKMSEWATVHGYYYGTPKDFLEDCLSAGKNVISDIDVQGGLKIKEKYPLNSVLIFIMPPSMKILEKRLRARKKDNEKTIKIRLENARKELKEIKKYDYLIINDKIEKATEYLKNIVMGEQMRMRSFYLKNTLNNFFDYNLKE